MRIILTRTRILIVLLVCATALRAQSSAMFGKVPSGIQSTIAGETTGNMYIARLGRSIYPAVYDSSNILRQDFAGEEPNQSIRFPRVAAFAVGCYPAAGKHDWKPAFSLRAGYGGSLDDRVMLRVYLEYTQYTLAQSGGIITFTSLAPRRHDAALYAALVFLRVVEIGFGIAHTAADPVLLSSPDGHVAPWPAGGRNEFRTYLSIGVQYAVPLGQHLSVPIGVDFRALDYGTDATMRLRIGPEWTF